MIFSYVQTRKDAKENREVRGSKFHNILGNDHESITQLDGKTKWNHNSLNKMFSLEQEQLNSLGLVLWDDSLA